MQTSHADVDQELDEASEPGFNWLAVAVGSLIIFAGYYYLYNEMRPAEDEYVPAYLVALGGILAPAFVGGAVAGLIARRSPGFHAMLSVIVLTLGGFVLRIFTQFGVFDIDLKVSVMTVFATGWAVAAPIGGHLVGRLLLASADRKASVRNIEASKVDDGDAILVVDDLTMHYKTQHGWVSAVDDVSFRLRQGEAFGLVGESGCGKTSVAMALLRLNAENGHFKKGEIRLDGVNLLTLTGEEMRQHRWSDISMVFQGAMNAWNPVYTVHDQIREAMDLHLPDVLSDGQIRERIAELFELVGLDPVMMDRYPHEFSGWHAPAGCDRHGPFVQPQGHHR